MITATRAFLRYLAFRGDARADLALAIPAVAHWRLASVPHHLSPDQLTRVLAGCDGDQPARVRDRAMVLLLARLGLRAGDVAQLRLSDLQLGAGHHPRHGQGPLPGPAATAAGGRRGRAAVPRVPSPVPETDRVFVTTIAPVAPLRSGDAVSSVVARALERAGVHVARPGAHVLRHTAATEMLRQGVSLDHIGLVLRHRSLDMSAYYAKVDIGVLRQVAQPWPGRRLMTAAVDAYVALRRVAGFALCNTEDPLHSFARFAHDRHEAHICTTSVIAWASQGPSLAQRHRRYETVRQFAVYAQLDDPRHDTPPPGFFRYRKTRRPPRLYTPAEIDQLVAAALRLSPPDALRPQTYATLISLLAATGLRIAEALALTVADLTPDGLLIRKTKFQKTRLVPLHDTVIAGLGEYLRHRCRGRWGETGFSSRIAVGR